MYGYFIKHDLCLYLFVIRLKLIVLTLKTRKIYFTLRILPNGEKKNRFCISGKIISRRTQLIFFIRIYSIVIFASVKEKKKKEKSCTVLL